jgi:UPF0288 family protein (methanogenesis marker protein 3)
MKIRAMTLLIPVWLWLKTKKQPETSIQWATGTEWTFGPTEPEDIEVSYLGEAREDIEKAGFSLNVNNVICSSFN